MRQFRLVSILTALGCLATSVYAHAILLSANPTKDESVQGTDVQINLRFNSRVDAKRSRMTLVVPDGNPRPLAINDQSPPDSLKSEVHGLKSGSYTLQWQVLAVDGHISRGEIPFKVH
jgi:methionine-rich copper-binding protein CopC